MDENRIILPDSENLTRAVRREKYMHRFRLTVRSTFLSLVVVAAAAVLVAVLLLPILRIYGKSMSGTLNAGDIVVSVKSSRMETGDIVAFYYNNNILVKRVIGHQSDMIDMDNDGTVYVNGVEQEEPYLNERAYGETNIELPYQVPDGKIFVMGDNRELFRSKRMYSTEKQTIAVDITGVRVLELRLDEGDKHDKDFDHGDWANAWLEAR